MARDGGRACTTFSHRDRKKWQCRVLAFYRVSRSGIKLMETMKKGKNDWTKGWNKEGGGRCTMTAGRMLHGVVDTVGVSTAFIIARDIHLYMYRDLQRVFQAA